jgi:hypothetical protein
LRTLRRGHSKTVATEERSFRHQGRTKSTPHAQVELQQLPPPKNTHPNLPRSFSSKRELPKLYIQAASLAARPPRMNTAYAQQGSPPHDMHRDGMGEPYRSGAPGAPQYPVTHTMPVPQQSQIPQSYGNPYNPLATTRAPIPEGMQIQEGGLPSLAVGPQPAMQDPLPRSCVENGWRYEYVAWRNWRTAADPF